MDNISQHVASQMLDALLCTNLTAAVDDVSRDAKIELIVDRIDSIDEVTKYGIGDVFVRNERWEDLQVCSEGTVIHLDPLSDKIIDEIYDLIVSTAPAH